MSNIEEKLEKVIEQRNDARDHFERAKLVFDKCSVAIEKLETLLEDEKKSKKDKEVKKK